MRVKANRKLPSIDFLKSILSYNPETGVLNWKARTPDMFKVIGQDRSWNAKYAGKVAGDNRKKNSGCRQYSLISIYNQNFLTHRVCWAIFSGVDPIDLDIDHINHDPSDNRACNLRACSRMENNLNSRGDRVRKYDLPKGVYAARHKFVSNIQVNGKLVRLGRFDTPEEAHQAYCNAAEKLHKDFACCERKGQPLDGTAPSGVEA